MHNDVINDYLNRDVEVSTTSSKTFTGNLKLHDSQKGIVVIEPKIDKYSSRRYGEVVIRQHDIVSVREILPRIEEDDADEEMSDGDYKMKSDSRDLSIFASLGEDDSADGSSS